MKKILLYALPFVLLVLLAFFYCRPAYRYQEYLFDQCWAGYEDYTAYQGEKFTFTTSNGVEHVMYFDKHVLSGLDHP
jgi:hypothetical protein